jgi:methyl-accepting chemotaxis protein
MQRMLDGVKSGHQDIVDKLADALGQAQSQDVMRQRVQGVQLAMAHLDNHLQGVAEQLVTVPWNPTSLVAMRERLDQQLDSYVMQSQRETHLHVTGGPRATSTALPRIELF